MNEEELKKKLTALTPEQYAVLREKGTEAPFSGKYVHENKEGTYTCVVCGNPLFSSKVKADSTKGPTGLQGWPSFEEAIPGAINFTEDNSYGMHRTEITCAKCGSHLGHLFDDSSTSTGKHYCVNSVCLDLKAKL